MKEPTAFVQYLLSDVFSEIGGLHTKNMFGGTGFYIDGSIFAFTIDDNQIVFKVDKTNEAQYREAGSRQFVYTGHTHKGPVAMPYWTLPEELLEEPRKVAQWALQSAAISANKK